MSSPKNFRYTLRKHQIQDINTVSGLVERGRRRIVWVMPTGAGKTICAAWIMGAYAELGLRVGFMVERRALIEQTSDKLRQAGLEHSILMAGYDNNIAAPIQLISRDTLTARAMRSSRMHLPPLDLFFRDEAHRGVAETDMAIYEAYGDIPFIGLTATPALRNGSGLGFFYQDMVHSVTHQDLIDAGLLLKNVIYQPNEFDDSRLRSRDGDFLLSDANSDQVVNQTPIGSVVRDWKKYSEGLPTVAFCTTIKHSRWLCEHLNSQGIAAAAIDMKTPLAEREIIRQRSIAGDVKVVTSCEVMGYGVDWPWLGCCIHLRPCRSEVPWIQFCGRANRISGDKKYAVQIDHVGNCARLGFPEDLDRWRLSGNDQRANVSSSEKKPPAAKCGTCQAVKPAPGPCAVCGAVPEVRIGQSQIGFRSGDLTRATRSKPTRRTPDQRAWDAALGVAIHRGMTINQAAGMFKRKTGKWPNQVAGLKKAPFEGVHYRMDARKFYDTYYKRGRHETSGSH